MTPIYELETKNVNFWKIFSYLLSCDLGYLRFDYDEKGFLDAQKRGIPHIHPKHHLDINFSNSSTFKSGLIKKISQQEFIDIILIYIIFHLLKTNVFSYYQQYQ